VKEKISVLPINNNAYGKVTKVTKVTNELHEKREMPSIFSADY
jgi:hypothetical protein